MKKMLLMLALSSSWPLAAQTKFAFTPGPQATKVVALAGTAPVAKDQGLVRQIAPSPATGSSQAVIVDEVPLAHTRQFLPLNQRGNLVGKDDLSRQVNQVFDHITTALKAAGAGTIVKLHVYLAQAELLAPVQELLGKRFQAKIKPAVSFVVGELAHAGALVAMDAIATAPAATGRQVRYFAAPMPAGAATAQVAILPAGPVVYVSGQADNGALEAATRGTLQQLAATLKHLGLQKQDVVQIKAFIRPMSDLAVVNQVLGQFFQGATVPPVVYVHWLSQNPIIEIELIAASPKPATPASGQLEFITPPFFKASPVYSKVTRLNRGKKVYVSGLYGQTAHDDHQQVSEIFTSLEAILKKSGSDFKHLAKATYYVSTDQASTGLNEIRPRFYDPKRPPAASKALVRGVGPTGKSISLDMIGVVIE